MNRKFLIAGGAAAACALIALLWINSGIYISWDSEAYIAAAQTRQQFGGLPKDYASFPPLYPLLLSLFSNILLGANLINVVSFALIGWLTMLLLDPDPLAALALGLALILSPALSYVQHYAWSEPLFLALTLLFFYGIKRRSLPIITVAVALACLQRYVGLALIPVGLVVVWRMPKRSPRRLLLYLLGASTPIGIWLLRNILLGWGALGVRHPGVLTMIDILAQIAGVGLVWLPYLIAAGIVAHRVSVTREVVLAAALHGVFHSIMVIYGALTTNLDPPNQRLLAPLYVPMLLLAVAALHRLLKDRVFRCAGAVSCIINSTGVFHRFAQKCYNLAAIG